MPLQHQHSWLTKKEDKTNTMTLRDKVTEAPSVVDVQVGEEVSK